MRNKGRGEGRGDNRRQGAMKKRIKSGRRQVLWLFQALPVPTAPAFAALFDNFSTLEYLQILHSSA